MDPEPLDHELTIKQMIVDEPDIRGDPWGYSLSPSTGKPRAAQSFEKLSNGHEKNMKRLKYVYGDPYYCRWMVVIRDLMFITFVNIEAARERETYLSIAKGEVSRLENVKGVYLTFGESDVVVVHEAENLAEGVLTAVKIRNIPGVTKTKTIVCLKIEDVFG